MGDSGGNGWSKGVGDSDGCGLGGVVPTEITYMDTVDIQIRYIVS
jgi:hypothetical protein